jgi:hypothetical protein
MSNESYLLLITSPMRFALWESSICPSLMREKCGLAPLKRGEQNKVAHRVTFCKSLLNVTKCLASYR